MSHTPNYDEKVKKILDSLQPGERVCALTGEKWFMDEEEIGWYRKFNVPPSDLSPRTRAAVCYAWAVGAQWWWNKHPETGKPILSNIHPYTGYKVLPDEEWFAKDFIKDSEPTGQTAMEKIHYLLLNIPLLASRSPVKAENSISITSLGDQNSYFVAGCRSKNSFFSSISLDIEDSAEIYLSQIVNNSYNVIRSKKIFNCRYVRESSSCQNCSFIFDCRDCEYVFGGTNLRKKKYVFMNKQLTENEYLSKIAEIDFTRRSNIENYLDQFKELIVNQSVWPQNWNDKSENSTGEYLVESNGCHNCYHTIGAVNNSFCDYLNTPCESNLNIYGASSAFDNYLSLNPKFSRNAKFCCVVTHSQNVEYCVYCYNCENCFGCVGLQHKKFCIFNVQYSEEDYWQRLDQIKTEMLNQDYGKFFPTGWSFAYVPESPVVFYLGGDEKLIEQIGAINFDPSLSDALGQELSSEVQINETTIISDSIDDFTDEMAKKVYFDRSVNRRFSFLKPEVDFYRHQRLAPPNNHFIARIKKLFFGANVNHFVDKKCDLCGIAFKAAINLEYPTHKIYCHSCYLKYLEENN